LLFSQCFSLSENQAKGMPHGIQFARFPESGRVVAIFAALKTDTNIPRVSKGVQ